MDGQGKAFCACTGVQHFFLELLQILELAEEDGIVRIRRGDFTKRRLPVCNSFWRPWNCYSEKFSSCNSSTESPQIGRIQPPYNHPQHPLPPPPPLPRLSEAWLHESFVGLWMQRFGFLWILQLLKIFWVFVGSGWHTVSHNLMPLSVHP